MADTMPEWNTTCAIWHEAEATAATVAIDGVPCRLEPDPVLDGPGTSLVWTHRLKVPAGTDIRDGADGEHRHARYERVRRRRSDLRRPLRP